MNKKYILKWLQLILGVIAIIIGIACFAYGYFCFWKFVIGESIESVQEKSNNYCVIYGQPGEPVTLDNCDIVIKGELK